MKMPLFLSSVLILSACVHSPKQTEIIELEDGSYRISAISESDWSGDFLASALLRDAEGLCQKQNKKFERISVNKEDERRFNYSNSTVVFRCNP